MSEKPGRCQRCGGDTIDGGSTDLYKKITSRDCGMLMLVPSDLERCHNCGENMCEKYGQRYCQECSNLIICVYATDCNDKKCKHRVPHDSKTCDKGNACALHPLDNDRKCILLFRQRFP